MKGEELRKARRAAGLTQEELAWKADIAASYVSMLERDERTASPSVASSIRNAFERVKQDAAEGFTDSLLDLIREKAKGRSTSGRFTIENGVVFGGETRFEIGGGLRVRVEFEIDEA